MARWRSFIYQALIVISACCLPLQTVAGESLRDSLTLLSTTSTENSGLLDYLLPKFEREAKIRVFVVAVGTGQAIRSARDGNGDLLLVHDPESEIAFLESGYGHSRIPFMYNDYVLVGPRQDPAGVGSAVGIVQALEYIASAKVDFVSRGDESGTHKKEKSLWALAQLDPHQPKKTWYRSTGAGMGKTLNIAAAKNAYTLTDRGTWLSFNNKQDLVVLSEGGDELFNQYSLVQVSAEKHPHINETAARALVQWLISNVGQAAIGAFRVDKKSLFIPNYGAGHGH